MNKVAWAAWAVKNIICVVCWTVLAIVFNKWWIALFGLLFMTSIKQQLQYYRICDKCGKHSPYANGYNEALDAAKAEGWVHYAEGNKDYCPECYAGGDIND